MTLAVVSRVELPPAAAVESQETVMNPMDSSGGGGGGAKTLWKPVVDPNSGKTYYVNRETKETVWKKPADADTPWIKGGAAGGSGGGVSGDALPDGWVEHFDPKKQKPYYHNTATGETSWRRPTPCVACDECIAPPTLPCQRVCPRQPAASHLLCSANSDSGEDSIEV